MCDRIDWPHMDIDVDATGRGAHMNSTSNLYPWGKQPKLNVPKLKVGNPRLASIKV